eukprot:CAMPEP_0172328778 /NCGR_PEP_ID=MMETSP1058-20130122/60530_1 /TAXON_ID=83371 /ORGANISM="Detonula confervacea, Strain CCMP 353" /LENGTH=845 /DNA_ID=CAMNT_0013045907 /DNA_START=39 /DNA_END=2575 /DNA_ORIENTATION=+
MSAPTPSQSPIEALPRSIATSSILPFVTSNDWLNFRVASRSCYEFVHNTADVSHAFCPICRMHGAVRTSTSNETCYNTTNSGGGRESETLWRIALVRDYQFEEAGDEHIFHQSIHSPVNSQSDAFVSTNNLFTASNSFISWTHWRKIDLRLHRQRSSNHSPPSERVVGPYFLRAGSMWQKIEQWCDDEERSGTLGREIISSLSPGRALDINPSGRVPNKEVSALKAVYAFYAGQCDPMMAAPAAQPHRYNPFSGLFGGYQAYDIISNTRWMEPEFDHPQQLIIAKDTAKTIAMDLATGQIYSWHDNANKLVATPCAGGINGLDHMGSFREEPANPFDSKDSILRWFEEHARCLHQNFYSIGNNTRVRHRNGDTLYSLMRYPTVADTANCSRAVTRGVEIVVSAIFVPEIAIFVYSIRLRLLTPEDGEEYMSPKQRGFDTCQLVSRYWKISKSSPNLDVVLEEVRGEGVIGLYPLLHEGGYTKYQGDDQLGHVRGVFSYQSCTQADMPGFMEGHLQFRPGSLVEPSGQTFNARVAPFPLEFSSVSLLVSVISNCLNDDVLGSTGMTTVVHRWMEPEFDHPQQLIIAKDTAKTIAMDLATGQIYSWHDNANKLVATPCAGGINGLDHMGSFREEPANPFDSKDSILRWFEEHARRLHKNFYSVGNIVLPGVNGGNNISLLRYPSVADTANCSRAVTRGVEIVVSSIFVPEFSIFVYSIRLRLLTPEDGEGYMSPKQRGFDTCQLVSRYWKISKSSPNLDVVLEEVRGEGVIGLYPLLHEGGYTKYQGDDQLGHVRGVFSYQSCTQADMPGFMEGHLQFRPGSLVEPSGQMFNARVAPFPLKFSQYLY